MINTDFLAKVRQQLQAKNARLVAVSKTKPINAIMQAYHNNQRIFGENKVQEMVEKHAQLPNDIEWHLIGHLQTNKVKYIAPFVKLIHSIDSQKLLAEVNKRALQNNRVIDCLLQIHIANENTKFGMSYKQVSNLLESIDYQAMTNIAVKGVMGMATFTSNQQQIGEEFKQLKHIFEKLKTCYFAADNQFCEISMGMSGDYEIALEKGSTLVRIGSKIFGNRQYV